MKVLIAGLFSALLVALTVQAHSPTQVKKQESAKPKSVATVQATVTPPKSEIQPAVTETSQPKQIVQGCEQYRSLVTQYAWDVSVAMAVMKAESGCNPMAANNTDNHRVCMGSFGLFQISCHSGQIYDPAQNVRIAWLKYSAINPRDGMPQKWRPWGAYNSGAYLKYL